MTFHPFLYMTEAILKNDQTKTRHDVPVKFCADGGESNPHTLRVLRPERSASANPPRSLKMCQYIQGLPLSSGMIGVR